MKILVTNTQEDMADVSVRCTSSSSKYSRDKDRPFIILHQRFWMVVMLADRGAGLLVPEAAGFYQSRICRYETVSHEGSCGDPKVVRVSSLSCSVYGSPRTQAIALADVARPSVFSRNSLYPMFHAIRSPDALQEGPVASCRTIEVVQCGWMHMPSMLFLIFEYPGNGRTKRDISKKYHIDLESEKRSVPRRRKLL